MEDDRPGQKAGAVLCWALWGFDFCANQSYTMGVFSQYGRKASRLGRARGSDQDGRATLVPEIVARGPFTVKVERAFDIQVDKVEDKGTSRPVIGNSEEAEGLL
jgi:hypothetical protein